MRFSAYQSGDITAEVRLEAYESRGFERDLVEDDLALLLEAIIAFFHLKDRLSDLSQLKVGLSPYHLVLELSNDVLHALRLEDVMTLEFLVVFHFVDHHHFLHATIFLQ